MIRILARLLVIALILSAFSLPGYAKPTESVDGGNFGTILTTDLSLDLDVDDWYDVYKFVRTPNLHPVAIILTGHVKPEQPGSRVPKARTMAKVAQHYATTEVRVEDQAREFLSLLGRSDMPLGVGVTEPLSPSFCGPRAPCNVCNSNEGVKLILDTLRRAPQKIKIISVGSMRNEATALRCDPELMQKKLAAIYIVAGRIGSNGGINFRYDPLAAQMIIESNLPIVWMQNSQQRVSGADERRYFESGSKVARFLSQRVAAWRAHKGPDFMTRTKQWPEQGRNLWAIPAFLHASGDTSIPMQFVRGTMTLDTGTRALGFIETPNGTDLMMKKVDNDAASTWQTGLLMNEVKLEKGPQTVSGRPK